MLKRAGRTVAVIERGEIGGGETGHTTAHVTYATDTRLTELVKTFGRGHAQAAWDAGHFAMEQIADIVATEGIDCELQRVPGYLVAAAGGDTRRRRRNSKPKRSSRRNSDSTPPMWKARHLWPRPAIRFANQLEFHPLKYHQALAQRIPGDGSHIFEKTEAAEFARSAGMSWRMDTASGSTMWSSPPTSRFRAHQCDRAQHCCRPSLQPIRPTRSARNCPAATIPEALFWDTADPYLYLRVDRRAGGDYVILGGADHKTGQEADTERPFEQVANARCTRIWPDAEIDHRWSGQVIETIDGLPFIGETAERQFVATGFAGNGMTFGTLAAIMARDRVLGRGIRGRTCSSVERKNSRCAVGLPEGKQGLPLLPARRPASPEPQATRLDACSAGEGKILRLDGQQVAAYRDDARQLTTLLRRLHASRLHRRLERRREDLGLPVPRLALHGAGRSVAGPAVKPLANANVPARSGRHRAGGHIQSRPRWR